MYIAQKPCSFASQDFKVGDTIPEKLVLPEAVTRLIKAGVIAVAGAGPLLPATSTIEELPQTVEVPILADEGEAILDMTIEDLLMCVRAVQLPKDQLIAELATIENEDALILIDVITGHDEEIYAAANARAEELAGGIPETEEELMKLTRPELAEIAQNLGKEVADADTKKVLVAFILKAKAESAE